ncbi:hypothetical protein PR003_g29477 [Phytophthora rubi]|uniref:Uncharacterized protein n=1 Tax=Phytophthora rubi TaxID=129364 RepID=A0A6A4BLD6_9STRA|nr:hypothetical protein PR003_g29477 [Phytophthora rubi]
MVRSRNRAQRTQEEKDNDARVRWDRLLYEEEKRQQNLARFQLPAPQNLARFQLPAPQNDSDDEGGALCSMYDRADHVMQTGTLAEAQKAPTHKWELDDKSYNIFFRACVALTNYSVRLHREDGEGFLRYEAQLIQIGLEIEAVKKHKQQEYRDGRRARLELTARSVSGAVRTGVMASRDDNRRRLSLDRSHNASPYSATYGSR